MSSASSNYEELTKYSKAYDIENPVTLGIINKNLFNMFDGFFREKYIFNVSGIRFRRTKLFRSVIESKIFFPLNISTTVWIMKKMHYFINSSINVYISFEDLGQLKYLYYTYESIKLMYEEYIEYDEKKKDFIKLLKDKLLIISCIVQTNTRDEAFDLYMEV